MKYVDKLENFKPLSEEEQKALYYYWLENLDAFSKPNNSPFQKGIIACLEQNVKVFINGCTYGEETIRLARKQYAKYRLSKMLNTLNREEKQYLENVLRPFKDEVVFIEKNGGCRGTEYLFIQLKKDSLFLPSFEQNSMYIGMEVDKKYTLKELGLFE